MPVPKRRLTSTRKRTRSANKHYVAKGIATCSNCQQPKLPHHVCRNCGFYGQKQILKIEEK